MQEMEKNINSTDQHEKIRSKLASNDLAYNSSGKKKPQLLVKYRNLHEVQHTAECVRNNANRKFKSIRHGSLTQTTSSDLSSDETLIKEDNIKNIQDENDVFTLDETFEEVGVSAIKIDNDENIEIIIELFEQDENVEYVQLNYPLEPLQIPENEYYTSQWSIKNTGQVVNGIAGVPGVDISVIPVWEENTELENILVGVIDTGIDINHPSLSGRTVNGYDFFNDKETVFDEGDPSHGTGISAIIAANWNSTGIAGIAPNATLIPMKFMQNGIGYTSDAIRAIEYAAGHGVKIINCSWGSNTKNQALKAVMQEHREILFVCAAGNNGNDIPVYPASFRLSNIISVASINNTGCLASGSCFGPTVDIAAPGKEIFTAGVNSSYTYMNGTSAAAAHMSGAAALYLGAKPGIKPSYIRQAIIASATHNVELIDKVNAAGYMNLFGAINYNGVPEVIKQTFPTIKRPPEVIKILETNSIYKSLTTKEKELLVEYLHISDNIMTVWADAGCLIKESLKKARIMQWLDISMSDVILMIDNHGSENNAYIEAQILKKCKREFSWLTGESEKILIELLISGYKTMNVSSAYLASNALKADIKNAILKLGTVWDHNIFDNFTDSDLDIIKSIVNNYSLDPNFINDYLTKYSLSPQDLQGIIIKYQADVNASIKVGENTAFAHTETESIGVKPPESPFLFNGNGNGDGLVYQTGALGYTDNIIKIPGVNGLDLDLSLQYNSDDSTSEIAFGKIDYDYRDYYSIWISAAPIIDAEEYFDLAYGSYDERYKAYNKILDRARADDYWIDIEICTVEQVEVEDVLTAVGPGFIYYDEYVSGLYSLFMSLPRGYSNSGSLIRGPMDFYEGSFYYNGRPYNDVSMKTYDNPFEYMGDGWSFGFPRVIISNATTTKYLRFPNGATYEYKMGVNSSNLKNYLVADLVFTAESISTYNNSKYKLSYKDGIVYYFDEKGRLIGKKDRFGNTIDFKHNISSGYNGQIIITDTANRIVTIDYNPSLVTITLPDTTKIKYTLMTQGKGRVLSEKIDQKERKTTYTYDAKNVDFDFYSTILSDTTKKSITYNLLSTVTYPSKAVSKYEYQLALGNITNLQNVIGRTQYYRLCQRQDIADLVSYNRVVYSYSDNNYTGYPSTADADNLASTFEYSVTATRDNDLSQMYTFNNKHLNSIVDLKLNNVSKSRNTFEYDATKQLTSTTEQLIGAVTQATTEYFSYDIQGNLRAYWDKQAGSNSNTEHKKTITYDNRFCLPLDITYKKDSGTTIIERNILTDDGKNVSTFQYLINNVLSGQSDFIYDSYGNIKTKNCYVSPSRAITNSFTYDSGVYLISESTGDITLNYTYDVFGRRLTAKDGKGYQTTHFYDEVGRIIKITNPDDSYVQYEYDDIALTMTKINDAGLKIKTICDKLGNVKQVQDITPTSAIINLEIYTYDTFMNVKTRTDACGTVTDCNYDSLNRLLSKTIGGSAYKETYVYDDALNETYSRITKTIEGEINAPSIKTVVYKNLYGFEEKAGRVINNIEQLNICSFDYLGNQLLVKTPDNITTSFQYDGANRLIKTTNPDGSIYQQSYDWLGRKITTTDPKGAVANFTYDDLGRLTIEETPFTDIYKTVKSYSYDNNGNILSQRMSNNKPGAAVSESRTDYKYSNRNYLTKVISFNNNVEENYVTYTYDTVGNKLTMSVANGAQTTNYRYDERNRLVKLTDPIGNIETYTYDDNNNLLTKTDRKGTIITNGYDTLNRLISVSAQNSNGTNATEYMTYQYYKTGALKQQKNESVTTVFNYDDAGRVIQQTETTNTATAPLLPNAVIIKSFGYNVRDNRISLGVTRNGITDFVNTYEYDSMNRLIKVYDNNILQAAYSYDLNGNRQTLTCGNGIITSYSYNMANLVTNLTNSN